MKPDPLPPPSSVVEDVEEERNVPRVAHVGDTVHVQNRAGDWVPAIVERCFPNSSFMATDQHGRTETYHCAMGNWVPEGQKPPRKSKPVHTTVSTAAMGGSSDPQGRQLWRRAKLRLRHIEQPTADELEESAERDTQFKERIRRKIEGNVLQQQCQAVNDVARALQTFSRRERRLKKKRKLVAIELKRKKLRKMQQAIRDTRRFLKQLEEAAEPPANRVMRTPGGTRLFVQLIERFCAVIINTSSGEQWVLHGPVKHALLPFERIALGPVPEEKAAATIRCMQGSLQPQNQQFTAPLLEAEAKRMLDKLGELLAVGFVSDSEFQQRRRELLAEMGDEGKIVLDNEEAQARAAEEQLKAEAEMRKLQEEQDRLLAEEQKRKAAKKKRRMKRLRKKKRARLQRIYEEHKAINQAEYEAASSKMFVARRSLRLDYVADAIQDRMENAMDSMVSDSWFC